MTNDVSFILNIVQKSLTNYDRSRVGELRQYDHRPLLLFKLGLSFIVYRLTVLIKVKAARPHNELSSGVNPVRVQVKRDRENERCPSV